MLTFGAIVVGARRGWADRGHNNDAGKGEDETARHGMIVPCLHVPQNVRYAPLPAGAGSA